jgi:peptidoglycan/LPS O-acetylase OafA/YrhL
VQPFADLVAPFGSWYHITLSLGAAALVAGTIMSDWVRKVLEMRIPRYLGRISFSLYLVHYPLLGTFFVAMYYRLNQPGRWTSGHLAAVISIPVYAVVTLLCATLLAVAVDEPLLKLLSMRGRRRVPSAMRDAQPIPVSVKVVVPGVASETAST